jgi:glycerol uptake facilitator-like aquaporin
MSTLRARLLAEGLGTALLLATVVGSGIMGERLAGGSVHLALLANSIATGCAMVALIVGFGPVSGAHFNPVVTAAALIRGRLKWPAASLYLVVQVLGAIAGVAGAHVMFEVPLFEFSGTVRTGTSQWWSEVVATFGLLVVILRCGTDRPWAAPFAVGGYIVAAYWFTASTSFANPAVTLARSLTPTFSGIRPTDVAGFVAAQACGAAFALWLDSYLGESFAPDQGRVRE